MHHLKHVQKINELFTGKTCKKWVGCSTVRLTPNPFLQTFFQLGDMVVSMIHHSSTKVPTSGDSASNHCLLVVPNQKSKSPLSIRRRHCLQFRTHLLNSPRCWATFLPLVHVDVAKVLKSFLVVACLVVPPLATCAKTPSLILSKIR